MFVHKMGLYEKPFTSIKMKKKIVEVRLNDEKRRKVNIGDTIEFTKIPAENDTINVEVIDLRRYNTFKEMYDDIPFKDFDCDGSTIEQMLAETYEIYTPEQEKQWGTLAITIKVLEDDV